MNNNPAFVLINPASQSGTGLRVWEKIYPLFEKAGVNPEVLLSSAKEGMAGITAQAAAKGGEVNLIVLGGDGTFNEVLNAVPDLSRVTMGYIPTGSSNDFARAVGIRDPLAAAGQILSAKDPILRDLGEVTCILEETGEERKSLFNVSCGMGFDAACCEAANDSSFKKLLNRLHMGKLVYFAVSVHLILTDRHSPCTIQVERRGETETLRFGRTLFAVCMNHRYEGGGFPFCPDADGADGELDLCVASDISRARFFALVPLAYKGGHAGKKGITLRRGEKFVISGQEPLYFHTDGEVPGKTRHMECRLLPGSLRCWN